MNENFDSYYPSSCGAKNKYNTRIILLFYEDPRYGCCCICDHILRCFSLYLSRSVFSQCPTIVLYLGHVLAVGRGQRARTKHSTNNPNQPNAEIRLPPRKKIGEIIPPEETLGQGEKEIGVVTEDTTVVEWTVRIASIVDYIRNLIITAVITEEVIQKPIMCVTERRIEIQHMIIEM